MQKVEIKELKKNSKYFLSTYISAICSRVPVLPLERLIILQQTNRMGKFKNLKGRTSNLSYLNNIRKKEGLKGIFIGNLTLLCKIVPHTALEFFFFEIIKKKLVKKKISKNQKKLNKFNKKIDINFSLEKKQISFSEKKKEKFFNKKLSIEKINFISGSFAGLISFYIMYPMEFFRVMTGLDKGPKNFYLPKSLFFIYKKYGFKNLYKGSTIASLSYVPYCGFKFFFFEFNKKILKKIKNQNFFNYQKNSKAQKFPYFHANKKLTEDFEINPNFTKLNIFEKIFAGGFAGIFAQILVYPLEIMGKRRMTQILDNETKNFKYKDLFFFMFKRNGFKEFRNGLMSNCQKVSIISAIGFVMNDLFKENLKMK